VVSACRGFANRFQVPCAADQRPAASFYYVSVVDGCVAAKDLAQVGRCEDKERERLQAFGERVRRLRETQGRTQEALAEAADLHRAEIGFVERAEREVGITLAWRLADGLGISFADLVRDLD